MGRRSRNCWLICALLVPLLVAHPRLQSAVSDQPAACRGGQGRCRGRRGPAGDGGRRRRRERPRGHTALYRRGAGLPGAGETSARARCRPGRERPGVGEDTAEARQRGERRGGEGGQSGDPHAAPGAGGRNGGGVAGGSDSRRALRGGADDHQPWWRRSVLLEPGPGGRTACAADGVGGVVDQGRSHSAGARRRRPIA